MYNQSIRNNSLKLKFVDLQSTVCGMFPSYWRSRDAAIQHTSTYIGHRLLLQFIDKSLDLLALGFITWGLQGCGYVVG